jgi:hypothetical protein
MRVSCCRGTIAAMSVAAHSRDRSLHRDPYFLVFVLAALAVVALALVLHAGVFEGSTASGEIRGSGVAATQLRTVPSFDGVELGGSNKVVVSVGRKQTVAVHADDNLLGRVTTRVERGALVVGNKPGGFRTRSPMYVEVTTPSLRSLGLSGSGVLSAEGIRSPHVTVILPGSGVIRASGSTDGLDVALAGSGDVELEQLVARDVNAVVSGSGRVQVTATNRLDASVTGAGAIFYGGDPPHVIQSVSGVGAISAR